ncbi:MAG: DUF1934 domain-containing protein [Bacillota bacterium]|nr:DUF1934 domain-containing protein [Bacillota bacterium]
MLKIIGKQIYEGQEEEEHMEFVTEGKLYEHEGAIYLSYAESDFSGMEGCTTSLKIIGDKVEMRRFGEAVALDTEMLFEKGKRVKGYYETPYGAIEMEVLTNDVVNDLRPAEASGRLNIDYHISLRGLSESRSRLDIEIM